MCEEVIFDLEWVFFGIGQGQCDLGIDFGKVCCGFEVDIIVYII